MPVTAYIALGSNVGDRMAMLAAALVALGAEEGVRVRRVSHAYESSPWGVADQPLFANAAARVDYDGEADDLLATLQGIEARLGRGTRREPNGPRSIDLDILLFGDEEWRSHDLTIPHPRMLERDFVVTPLLEIAPDATLPDGTRVGRETATQGRVVGRMGAIPGFGDSKGADGGGPLAGVVPSAQDAAEEWVEVAGGSGELADTSEGSGLALIMCRTVLDDAGIPSRWDPHAPNEGFSMPWGGTRSIRLMVPAGRAEEARALVSEVAAATPEIEDIDIGEPVDGVDPEDAAAANEGAGFDD